MSLLRASTFLAIAVATVAWSATVDASPLPGQEAVFQQLPLNGGLAPSTGGAAYPGHASLSTATSDLIGLNFSGNYVADDFSYTATTPIWHVEWYGSYLNQSDPLVGFLLAFETDNGGVPGAMVLNQTVAPGALSAGSGTFIETAIASPAGAPQLYRYNAELALPFLGNPDDVYWLKIVALSGNGSDTQWGWQNRDYTFEDTLASTVPVPGEANLPNGLGTDLWHFQNDAVTGDVSIIPLPGAGLAIVNQTGADPPSYQDTTAGPSGISSFGQDMAFSLYTVPVPEPSSLVLAGMGCVGLIWTLHRKRRR
ncbi:MAG: PEP-CTERM sorting domain-containing protein [Planctomycetota bacterium]|nr:MAG: PEP-CTERM sorting domain-containing protein [Planctomycetota bacterium]